MPFLSKRIAGTLALLILAAATTLKGYQAPQQSVAGGQPGNLKELSLEALSQIEVTTPSKHPTSVLQSPVAIFVLTSEDIRRSGATTIPEALRLAPGVEVARIDANRWSIGIRGFGSDLSRSMLVLIDGRTVYSTFTAGTYWQVQDTVMDDIERIEVIRGPGGTIWGPNAVNGVINIITKKTSETHGALTSVSGGNQEQGSFNFRYGGGNGKGLNYRFYSKGFTRAPEFHPDHRNFDDWRAAQTGFRIDWDRNDRDTLTFQGDLYREEAGTRATANSYTPPFTQDIDANTHLSGGNVMATWKHSTASRGDFQLQTFYDRTNRHAPNFGELRDTFDVDFLHHLNLAHSQQLSWGLGARFSTGRAIEVVSGLTFDPDKATDRLLTAFLQDEISLIPNRLSLTLGTKLLDTNYSGADLEPSVRLLWTPSDKQTVWAAFTHALRTPARVERDFFLSGYVGTTPTGVPYLARFDANRNFAPEQLNGYEAGYRRLLAPALYLDFAGFYNHYHDLLSEEITGPTFFETSPGVPHFLLPAQFRNGLLGSTVGGEIAPEWRPTQAWRLRASYAYLYMDLSKAPNSQDLGIAPLIERYSPRHQVVAQSAFDLSRSLNLDLTYRFVSSLTTQKVPSYSTGDVRLAWRLHPQVEFSVVGQNLFQPSHPEYSNDPGPLVGIRRAVYGRITFGK